MTWETFTRRTDGFKLGWLRRQLDSRDIPYRFNGRSWHAPILQVPADRWEEAWKILTPEIDEMPDNHAMFT